MEKKIRFTKENTLAIKGIAIFFLLTYHCLSSQGRLHGADVSFWPLSRETGMLIGRCMETCVGLFAFLSVYGMTLSIKKHYSEFEFTAKESTLFSLKRYLHLVFTFLLPYFFCVGVTFFKGKGGYGDGVWKDMVDALMDILCFSHIFGTKKLITTWWYLGLEVLLIVFLPVALKLYRKYSWLMAVLFMLIGSCFIPAHQYMTKYLMVLPLGICCADGEVFERLKKYSPTGNLAFDKILKFVVYTVLILAFYRIFDSQWGRDHFEFILNGILPVLVICWAYEFLIELPVLKQFLQLVGKHSPVIFYVHTFVRSKWMPGLTYSFSHAWQILAFVLIVSLCISVFLDLVKKILHYDRITAVFTDWMISRTGMVLK